MNKVRKKFLTAAVLSAGIYASFSIIPAYAAIATLSGIEISPASNGSYQIMVKTDKEVSVEKYVTSGNKIVLDLKNTRPSGFVNTVYNNASQIDHVVVQPVSDEEVRVFVQGTNVADSNISVNTKAETRKVLNQVNLPVSNDSNSDNNVPAVNTAKNTAKSDINIVNAEPQAQSSGDGQTIVLDRPVDNYKPVSALDNEDSQNVDSPIQSVKNEMGAVSLKKIFSTNAFDWILRFLMLAFIMIAAYKFFVPKKNVKINLSSERNRELDLLRTLNKKQGLIGGGLKPQQPNTLKTPGYSSISQYGLKEYQNSQLPPKGITTPKLRNQPNIPKTSIRNDSLLRQSNISTASKAVRTPVSPKIRNSDITSAKINIDSKKFLETMAKIYERSGRPDLARGIQNNIAPKQI